MDEELEEGLNRIYNIDIKVEFIDFRIYEIKFKEKSFRYFYEAIATLEYNIQKICEKIDKELIKDFKK